MQGCAVARASLTTVGRNALLQPPDVVLVHIDQTADPANTARFARSFPDSAEVPVVLLGDLLVNDAQRLGCCRVLRDDIAPEALFESLLEVNECCFLRRIGQATAACPLGPRPRSGIGG
jgi:hypothetical protein